jgi:aspartate aminotransferase-like enzyme
MDEVKVMLKHLFQTTNSLTLAIQTSGNGGNETIITNLLEPSEKILVAISGVWSGVIADMADRHGKNSSISTPTTLYQHVFRARCSHCTKKPRRNLFFG